MYATLASSPYRYLIFVGADSALLALAALCAFIIRFDGVIPPTAYHNLVVLAGLNILLSLPIFVWQKLYTINLSFVSIRDLYQLLKSITAVALLELLSVFLLRDYGLIDSFPRSTLILNVLLAVLFLGSARIAKRMIRDMRRTRTGKRVLVIGAEDAAAQLARSLLANHSYHLVGFLDESHSKLHTTIHGVPVLGTIANLGTIFKLYAVDEIIITTDPVQMRTCIATAREQGVDLARLKVLPSLDDIIGGKMALSTLRDISIEDLLGRESVKIDRELMKDFLQGKRVLVTGAAGSIGSTLIHEILSFYPLSVTAIDQNETAIFYLGRSVQKKFPHVRVTCRVADVCNRERIESIFAECSPDIVFHAAAYKHVPVMEDNPLEAIRNNIFGTLTVAECARAAGVGTFIFISTDKAVRPVSVMGRTKRMGEMLCVHLHGLGGTRFCAVRFGNVLDSQGNVIELFREQIKKGGPVEVTHPDMQRYFMVTSEACLLVMQAAALSRNGEIFCLDMGKPVRVKDIAAEMIRLAGFLPETDIPIIYTAPRPGERLSEELLIEGETPTAIKKIFVARLSGPRDSERFIDSIEKLRIACQAQDTQTACMLLENLTNVQEEKSHGR